MNCATLSPPAYDSLPDSPPTSVCNPTVQLNLRTDYFASLAPGSLTNKEKANLLISSLSDVPQDLALLVAKTQSCEDTFLYWKFFSKAKDILPQTQRVENLTWRMLHLNMKKAKKNIPADIQKESAPLESALLLPSHSILSLFNENLSNADQLSLTSNSVTPNAPLKTDLFPMQFLPLCATGIQYPAAPFFPTADYDVQSNSVNMAAILPNPNSAAAQSANYAQYPYNKHRSLQHQLSQQGGLLFHPNTSVPNEHHVYSPTLIGSGTCDSTLPLVCKNCATTATPLWRRDIRGNPLCNACGLFFKLHGSSRPVHLNKGIIKKRIRVKKVSAALEENEIASLSSPPPLLPNINTPTILTMSKDLSSTGQNMNLWTHAGIETKVQDGMKRTISGAAQSDSASPLFSTVSSSASLMNTSENKSRALNASKPRPPQRGARNVTPPQTIQHQPTLNNACGLQLQASSDAAHGLLQQKNVNPSLSTASLYTSLMNDQMSFTNVGLLPTDQSQQQVLPQHPQNLKRMKPDDDSYVTQYNTASDLFQNTAVASHYQPIDMFAPISTIGRVTTPPLFQLPVSTQIPFVKVNGMYGSNPVMHADANKTVKQPARSNALFGNYGLVDPLMHQQQASRSLFGAGSKFLGKQSGYNAPPFSYLNMQDIQGGDMAGSMLLGRGHGQRHTGQDEIISNSTRQDYMDMVKERDRFIGEERRLNRNGEIDEYNPMRRGQLSSGYMSRENSVGGMGFNEKEFMRDSCLSDTLIMSKMMGNEEPYGGMSEAWMDEYLGQ